MAGPRPREPEFLVVGHIARPHGVRGEVQVLTLTDRPDEVFAPGREVQLGDETGELPAHSPTLTVERSRPYRRGLLVKFEQIPDRTAAERLPGRYLLVATEELAPAEEGEVFYHQLLDAEVVTVAGETVGRVREVYETEPTHLLEVQADGKRHLVPFAESVVREVDVEHGRIVIDPPEGLLEL